MIPLKRYNNRPRLQLVLVTLFSVTRTHLLLLLLDIGRHLLALFTPLSDVVGQRLELVLVLLLLGRLRRLPPHVDAGPRDDDVDVHSLKRALNSRQTQILAKTTFPMAFNTLNKPKLRPHGIKYLPMSLQIALSCPWNFSSLLKESSEPLWETFNAIEAVIGEKVGQPAATCSTAQ